VSSSKIHDSFGNPDSFAIPTPCQFAATATLPHPESVRRSHSRRLFPKKHHPTPPKTRACRVLLDARRQDFPKNDNDFVALVTNSRCDEFVRPGEWAVRETAEAGHLHASGAGYWIGARCRYFSFPLVPTPGKAHRPSSQHR